MKKIIAAALVMSVASCSKVQTEAKTAGNALIDCAKAEANLASAGRDVYTIFLDIASQVAEGVLNHDLTAVVENLIVTYGEPIVACTMHTLAPSQTGSGSAATADVDPFTAAVRQTITTKGWQFK